MLSEYSNHGQQLQPETSRTELDLPRVLCVLSSMLEKLVLRNEKLMDDLSYGSMRIGKSLNAFHGVRAPNISIPKYLERIYKLLVTSVMVASKMLDDEHYNNAVYARVGGVSNAELNKLELELLFLLEFRVMVSSRVFENYCLHMEKEMVVNGKGLKIQRALLTTNEAEISSIEDNQSSSLPQILDCGLP
ncbi:putative cyclin [Lupinus albus]|uniref:Cyclin n=1 Tax=Lupinus albus TaxID=3870 RepID=A0A6A4MP20_LUPAL|nr:putative cyclin [Lupinus albus]